MSWTTIKPDFKEECLLLTASCFLGQWEYNLWELMKVEVDEGWYMGIYKDGEDWGDLADLKADLYFTMPLLTPKPLDRYSF